MPSVGGGDLAAGAEGFLVEAHRRALASDIGRLLGYVGAELGRLRVVQGELEAAMTLLDDAAKIPEGGGNVGHLVLVVAHRALAQHVGGNDVAAHELMASATAIPERGGLPSRGEEGRGLAQVRDQIGG